MSPGPAIHDHVGATLREAKASAERHQRDTPGRPESTDLSDVILGELRMRMIGPASAVGGVLAGGLTPARVRAEPDGAALDAGELGEELVPAGFTRRIAGSNALHCTVGAAPFDEGLIVFDSPTSLVVAQRHGALFGTGPLVTSAALANECRCSAVLAGDSLRAAAPSRELNDRLTGSDVPWVVTTSVTGGACRYQVGGIIVSTVAVNVVGNDRSDEVPTLIPLESHATPVTGVRASSDALVESPAVERHDSARVCKRVAGRKTLQIIDDRWDIIPVHHGNLRGVMPLAVDAVQGLCSRQL